MTSAEMVKDQYKNYDSMSKWWLIGNAISQSDLLFNLWKSEQALDKKFKFAGISLVEGEQNNPPQIMEETIEQMDEGTARMCFRTFIWKMIEEQKPEDNELEALRKKAQKWDALDEKIAKFYPEEDEGDEEEQGDLIDIGEAAAIAFGYL